LPAIVCAALLWVAYGSVAQAQEVLESNDEGQITLMHPARVGELTLAPGTYLLESKASSGRDVIRFIEVTEVQKFRVTRIFTGWYTETEQTKVGEAICRVEPLGAKVQATSMTIAGEHGTPRITRVMIKGEGHVHICQE